MKFTLLSSLLFSIVMVTCCAGAQYGCMILWWATWDRPVDPGLRPPSLQSIGFRNYEHWSQEIENSDRLEHVPAPGFSQVKPERRSPFVRLDDVISAPAKDASAHR